MATLNKKGTTILGRWRKDEETPDDDLVSERTREYALRSDRAILLRRGARFRSETGLHNWGWVIYGRVKRDIDLQTYTHRFGENLEAKGFERVI